MTLEHTATLLWDVSDVDPFAADNRPLVSDEMRAIATAARRAAPIDRAIAVLALASSADPRALARAPDGRAMVGARIVRLLVATMLNCRALDRTRLHQQIARAWAPDNKHAPDLIRRTAGAARRSRAERLDLHRAARPRPALNLYDAVIAGLAALKGPRHGGAGVLASQLVKTLVDRDVEPMVARARRARRTFCRVSAMAWLQARRSSRAIAAERARPRRGPREDSPARCRSASPKRTGEFVNIDYVLAVLARAALSRRQRARAVRRWPAASAGSRMPASSCSSGS